ncbi:MAG: PepSY domain-containing protein [Acidobacteria bacterium]|jgi:uncharacterized iron-regulated membrane protein|nr:PepSY domain-containing protein [Acidobacteriota bacterium]
MSGNVLNRKLHYWGAALAAIPLVVVVVTGLLLQSKKHWSWVQPAELRGTSTVPAVELSDILKAIREHDHPEVSVETWDDIMRLDVRPDRGVAKATLQNGQEVQVDLGTGQVMQVAYRRSDLIESIHDGSIFGDWVKLGIVLPTGLVLLFLWGSGMWMWIYPIIHRRHVRRRLTAAALLKR